jgi:hypothetical protein
MIRPAGVRASVHCGFAVVGPGGTDGSPDVYPAGGGTFSGGPQRWQVTEASCDAPRLCTASGGYDDGNGNPPGSIAANTTVGLNLLTLFESTVTLQSPDFTVVRGGDATLHLDRQFVAGSFVDLAPEATYSVTLIDRTADDVSEPLDESLTEAPDFVDKDRAVTVRQGHTYAISITTEIGSTVAGTGLLGGTTSARFDNVSLTVRPGGATAGARRLTDLKLASLLRNGVVGPAVLRGKRLSVRVRCPRAVGQPCRTALQGLLRKRKPATATQRAKVRKARAKWVTLRVKPRARAKLAGGAKATVYKRLKLVRR